MQAADIIEVGRDDDGVLHGSLGHADGPAIELARKVIANDALAQNRLIDDAEDGLTFVAQADEGDVKRYAGKERLGAVDGIEYPAILGIDVLGPELLAENAVIRIGLLDGRAHLALGFLVGDGHRRAIGLDFDVGGDTGVRRNQDPAGDVREFLGEGLELFLARFRKHVPEVSPDRPRSKRKAPHRLESRPIPPTLYP